MARFSFVLLCALAGLFVLPVVHSAEQLSGSVGGMRTLVVMDSMDMKETHSKFLEDMTSAGYDLTYSLASESKTKLVNFGEYLFDNVVLMAPETEKMTSALGSQELMKFMEAGNNILVLAGATSGSSSSVSAPSRELASACGVQWDKDGSSVLDYFSGDNGSTVRVGADSIIGNPRIVGKTVASANSETAFVSYRGVGCKVAEDNILAEKVLVGNPTTFSATPNKDFKKFQTAGDETLMVVAVQARNNGRITFSGSTDMCSDELMMEDNLNRALCSSLMQWTSRQTGIIRATNVRHTRADGSDADVQLTHRTVGDLPPTLFPDPEIARSTLVYRIQEDVTFSVDIEEWQASPGGGGDWVAFEADDVQLEFVMLDPYVRTALVSETGLSRFSTSFTLPDVYGIFKFRVLYRRPGLSTLLIDEQVSVRPFKHNEYGRFLLAAYPYYTSAFSVMIGFFSFSLFFMFSK